MSDWRRAWQPGGTYFFTLVAEHRITLFADDDARTLLGEVMRKCHVRWPVTVHAIALLPEHLHTLWELPIGDDEYPKRWGWIKKEFSKRWIASGHRSKPSSRSQRQERRSGVWQRHYWEHLIRDEEDLRRHVEYIHYNPVKHGLVRQVRDWPWSSFHRYVDRGIYPPDWGAGEPGSSDLEWDAGE